VRQQLGTLPFGVDRTRAFLGVEFKPGPGLSSLTAVQAAAARVEASEEAVVVHERQLAQQVRAAWLDLQAQTLQLEPSRAISSSTDEVVASYLRQYQVGRKTWLDVLNAQRETTQARYTLADLEAGIQAAHLRLLMLSGRIDARSLSRLGP
jgi:adhesin transport system outer membrane protein